MTPEEKVIRKGFSYIARPQRVVRAWREGRLLLNGAIYDADRYCM